ncbi:MAG: type IV pilin-like G/H family protein [Geitlerinemataceae cyanobacterium]
MKTEFKAKFLQNLNRKRKEGGFTLIELLVVIIIIGILAAIALPSFLNQAAKAKQSEGKSFVGAVNRAHQAYRLENSAFTNNFEKLGVGLPTETNNYTMKIPTATSKEATTTATPIDEALKGYSGQVAILDNGATATVLCESTEKNVVPTPTANKDGGTCAGGDPL